MFANIRHREEILCYRSVIHILFDTVCVQYKM